MNCSLKSFFFVSIKKLKFHNLSRDGKMLALSPGIKISISSKSGHTTFVLSTIKVISLMNLVPTNLGCPGIMAVKQSSQ